jgi:hypothetical protein
MKEMRRQWIILTIWFTCYISALTFLRFRFGVLEISCVALVVGVPIMLLFARQSKPN